MNILMTLFRDQECREYLKKTHPNESVEEIRNFYLGKEGIAGSEEGMTDLEKEVIINSLHEAGGIAILAHPAKDIDDMKELDFLREQGIDGLEIQPSFYEKYPLFEDYAKKHNLLTTYGSDYHGSYMDRVLLRKGINKLSPELEERLDLENLNCEALKIDERRLVCV